MTHAGTIALAALSIFAAACAHQGRGAAEGRAAAELSDAEIAAVLDVANRGEIEQAELARQRASEQQVRGYATAMIAGHGAAARQQSQILEQRGIQPEFNAVAGRVMDQSMQTQEVLRDLEGEAFDRAYMQAQLQQHRELLRMLDQELIPSVQDPQYRAYLEQLRGDIEAHLTNAERIQSDLVG